MEANVQSCHMVTCAKSYKPEATLRHKGLGHRIIQHKIYDGKVASADCIDLMSDVIILLPGVVGRSMDGNRKLKAIDKSSIRW